VIASEKSSISTYRKWTTKWTTRFPTSHRWTVCTLPLSSPKGGTKTRYRNNLSACDWCFKDIISLVAPLWTFSANVNSRSRSLYAIARPSVCLTVVCLSSVCDVGAPYSGGWNFRQFFFGVWYLGHPLTFTENFKEIVPGEPLRWEI